MAIYKENEADIDCSVIIPSYNSARSIKSCLDSIIGQKTDLNYEVIVADSSNDETPEIIRNQYPMVSLIHFARKTDPGTGRNAAIKQARGEIILCTDSDCIPAPDWLEQMVQTHRRKSGCRIVGGSVINGNPESLSSIAGYLNEFGEYLPTAKARMVNSLPTCNISYRRDIFEEYGGYHRQYYPQEEYHFHWRLHNGGEKLYFCPWIQVR
ncbi:MAG: glycosyltransferase, partial [Deltaproteobacteria bacterium]|nr:glycosyltransferase [Deltaproteobacteria bacterium]